MLCRKEQQFLPRSLQLRSQSVFIYLKVFLYSIILIVTKATGIFITMQSGTKRKRGQEIKLCLSLGDLAQANVCTFHVSFLNKMKALEIPPTTFLSSLKSFVSMKQHLCSPSQQFFKAGLTSYYIVVLFFHRQGGRGSNARCLMVTQRQRHSDSGLGSDSIGGGKALGSFESWALECSVNGALKEAGLGMQPMGARTSKLQVKEYCLFFRSKKTCSS